MLPPLAALLAVALGLAGCKTRLHTEFTTTIPAVPVERGPVPIVIRVGDVFDVTYSESSPSDELYRLAPGDAVRVMMRTGAPDGPYLLCPNDVIEISARAGETEDLYRLVSGDTINVVVQNQPELSREVEVLPDGRVSLPLIGPVPVRGMTVTDAGAEFTKLYQGRLDNPKVDVLVTHSAKREIHQEVTILADGTATVPMLGVVRLGGLSVEAAAAMLKQRYANQFASVLVDVLVVKPTALETVTDATLLPDGQVSLPRVGVVSLRGMTLAEASADLSNRYADIIPNARVDVLVTQARARTSGFLTGLGPNPRGPSREVTVPPDGIINLPALVPMQVLGEDLATVRENIRKEYARVVPEVQVGVQLSKRTNRQITVLGEVKTSGTFDASEPISAMRALALAGGPTDRAWLQQVLLLHPQGDGTLKVTVLDFDSAFVMRETTAISTAVGPDDLLYVPRSPISDINVFVQQFIRLNLPLDTGFTIGVWRVNDR